MVAVPKISAAGIHDNVPDLVSWILSGTYDANRPVLIDAENPTRFVSRGEATKLVARLAGCFEPDSTVCLHIPNDVLYPVLFCGILASRCRWTGTNMAYTASEIAHHFTISKTRYVVTMAESWALVKESIEAAGLDIEMILFTDIVQSGNMSESTVSNLGDGIRTMHDILRPANKAADLLKLSLDVDSVAVLMQTSGTTGMPKMAARTHHALVLESMAVEDAQKPYEIRRLFTTPIFHGFSAPQMIINALKFGHTSYFMKRFNDSFPDMVEKFQISETAAPPPMLLKFVGYNAAVQQKLQSLQMIWTGGAPLSNELRLRTLAIFSTPPRIVPVWGMTESGWFTHLKYPEVCDEGSVGRLIDGYELKLAEPTIRDNESNIPAGEIYVRSKHLMVGYLGNDAATKATLTEDGWLQTGDVGYMRDGKVFLLDRKKDLIKVNGWQVAPAELEDALLKSPDVLDAAVIGVGEGVDERPLAFVVAANSAVTAPGIKEHLLSRLTRYKVSRCGVCFVDSIPKSAAGKILKTVLRRDHAAGKMAEAPC